MGVVIVALTPEQDTKIEPLMDEIRRLSDAKTPGILVAQIFPGHMRVGVMQHEAAKEFVRICGRDPTSTIRVAPEREALFNDSPSDIEHYEPMPHQPQEQR